MLEDTRSFPFSASAQLVTEQLVQRGFIGGIPSYVCYQVPSFRVVKTTKVLWESESEFETFFENAMINTNLLTGTDIITNATISQSFVIIGSVKYYGGTLELTSYPPLGNFVSVEEKIITKKVNVIGFTIDGTPIWGDEYKGRNISIKRTVVDGYAIDPIVYTAGPPSPTSVSEIRKNNKSNYRYINGVLYYDLSAEIQDLES